ncbi:CHAD domain-containing protein [Caballeronia insecticola]|uniref:CHAD domain containing protein n=1 Tax=Caballeronia insecticola TaxID=758793 RepID=R4X129_9BURK|nr:CHAD domain-containing protein [Caballeronia insecticola]BAN25896.1 CHAD domain containing protein [Caballeronia insecticola]
MTVWIEVALESYRTHEAHRTDRSDDATPAALAGALEQIPAFAGVAPVRSRLATRDIPLKAAGWRLSVDTLDGARTLCATHEDGPPIPGFTRYRTFARPAGEDLAASLREFAEADDASRAPLAKAHRVAAPESDDGAPSSTPDSDSGDEVERIEWRIDAGGADILATLETDAQGRAALRLAAPAADGALDAVFRLAGEIIDAAPFFIAPDEAHELANDAANGAANDAANEPVFAAKLALPRTATRREAFIAIAASVAQQWFGNEFAARAGLSDEHVHQLRVAQRRLKTLLKLFRDDVDETWTTRIAPDLKWFGDLLADARDWDVFTDKTLPSYAASDDNAARWQTLIDAADLRRRVARDRVRDALASKRYVRLTLAFVERLARFASQEDETPVRLVSYAKKRIRKDYRRIARVADLASLEPHERHRVRIHAKRLRYALEFFRSVTTQRTRKQTAKMLGALQTVLGEANDAAVAADRLASMPEATDYQRGFARAWGAASARKDAQEGERLLRAMHRPRVRASL